jgi:hypothetical protein
LTGMVVIGKRSRPTLFRSSSAWKAFRIISCCSFLLVVVAVTRDFCTKQGGNNAHIILTLLEKKESFYLYQQSRHTFSSFKSPPISTKVTK